MAIIRCVDPTNVARDGKRLRASAFPDTELRKLNTDGAPSVNLASKITPKTLSKVQRALCALCRGRGRRSAEAWEDEETCKKDGTDCTHASKGMRGAVAEENQVEEIYLDRGAVRHFLVITEAPSGNPAHALIQASPEIPPKPELSDPECIKLQYQLAKAFRYEGTIDKVLKRFSAQSSENKA